MLFLELTSCTIAGWLLYVAAKEVMDSRQKLSEIAISLPVSEITQSALQSRLSNLKIETVDPDAIPSEAAEQLTFSSAVGLLLNNRRNPSPSAHYNNVNLKHPVLELTGIQEDSLDSALVVANGLAQAERDRDGFNPKKGLMGRAILLTLLLTVPLFEFANDSVLVDRFQAICTVITVGHALLLYRDWWDTQRDINTRSQTILKTAGLSSIGEIPAVHSFFHAQRRQIQIEAIAIPVAIAVALLYHYI